MTDSTQNPVQGRPGGVGAGCGRPSHLRWWRRTDRDGSRWVCATCHPPATSLEVVWSNAEQYAADA
jgi:hypothetical protein